MKILLLADANSIHTKKWVLSLAQRQLEICLFSFEKSTDPDYQKYATITIVDVESKNGMSTDGAISKITLLKYLPSLVLAIKRFKPDIVHAHYATSYGLLGALSGFKPFVLSVWGTDIYEFPKISFFHKLTIQFNLFRATKILSTSHSMAAETRLYTNKEIQVTPFGIDLSKFKKSSLEAKLPSEPIVIGTVKTLSAVYGIDYLIKAFKILTERNVGLPLKLMLVGEGQDKTNLVKLCRDLGIVEDVMFIGAIDNGLVPEYLNKMDVYAALSTSESFGVAIIEASACEIPVVVSNVGGLPEVVDDTITGFVVESKNPVEAALMIEKLVLNKELRISMGQAGRKKVTEFYDWDKNVSLMLAIYTSFND